MGPDLKGVTTRHDTDWLATPDQMLAEEDPIAIELLAKCNNVPMPNHGLTQTEVADLIAYLETQTEVAPAQPTAEAPEAAAPMHDLPVQRGVFRMFGELLDHPSPGLAETIGQCQSLVAAINPVATLLLGSFRAFVEGTPQGRLEEVHTGTFDLDAACHPYVGYHLLGESYKRSLFLPGLKERYRAQGYVADEKELPDRLSVMLSFLSVSADEDLNREIVREALLPQLQMASVTEQEAGYTGDRAHD